MKTEGRLAYKIRGFKNLPIEFQFFTDGSSLSNPGPWCSYAFIVKDAQRIVYKEAGPIDDAQGTNNRAELTAAIKAIEWLGQDRKEVELITDSEYVGKGIILWSANWEKTGWRVKNADLWKTLYDLTQRHSVYVSVIKGHSGQKENEMADEMAGKISQEMRDSSYV